METRYFIKKQKNSKEGIVHFLFSIEYKKIKISTNKKVLVTNWGKGFPKKTNATNNDKKLVIIPIRINNFKLSIKF